MTSAASQQTGQGAGALARVRQCRLTLHDGLYFATREIGLLFETERYIHNYALSYALFNDSLIRLPFYTSTQRPTYADDLALLNQAGVYVTPARPVLVDYQLVTYKIAQVTYHQRAERFGAPNYPRNIGRVKELAPGSTFDFFVLGEGDDLRLPRWIRLGKWMSKAEVEVRADTRLPVHAGEYICRHPLNPLDLGPNRLGVFNIISMPPVSLVESARLTGQYVRVGIQRGTLDLPVGMTYTFPAEVSASQRRTQKRSSV
jgi:CRISPR-associated protein Csc1